MTKMCLWLDLETTGDNASQDDILEAAWLISDWDLNEIDGTWKNLVQPINRNWQEKMIPVVVEMHEKSGLTRDLLDPEIAHTPMWRVEQRIIETLNAHGTKTTEWVLCGSGVSQLDSRFIKAQMNELHRRLMYYFIDIGQVRRYLRDMVGFQPSAEAQAKIDAVPKSHRADDDIRQHFEEAIILRDELRRQTKFVFGSD